ncbi:metal-dependent hydrolase [Kordia sp. SMS9]|uniref:metal-dependent hydrolase n=1 Tax=Kordia sp. SMS9 TaxID=2282170 RepID=UPI000E0D07C5|nr:metal-dependent hydrolase [Kordia sp. SMS9]AXG71882.1 metal-dependent hydrolase [Kordia sp. SMS9]
MKITYLGHASLHIEFDEISIIVDPFISGNPLASMIDVNDLDADYIFVTHAHQDHILDVETIAKNTGATIVSNYEIAMHYGGKDFNVFAMNHGGTYITQAFSAKYVNAIHTSSFPDGSYGGQPGGFVLTVNGKSIYIAGDTALTYDMKLIPLQTQLDLAILPIGDTFTMGVDDAVIASDFVACNKVLGYHYDSFPPIKIDHDAAQKTFANNDKELILLGIGESMDI